MLSDNGQAELCVCVCLCRDILKVGNLLIKSKRDKYNNDLWFLKIYAGHLKGGQVLKVVLIEFTLRIDAFS